MVRLTKILHSGLRRISRFGSLYGSKTRSLTLPQQNAFFKSKLAFLIALIFLCSNLFLSSTVLTASNYSQYIEGSKVLDGFFKLDLRLFQTSGFLNKFRVTSKPKVFVGKNRKFNQFSSNISSVAHWSKLLQVYEKEENPEKYLDEHKLSFHWADWIDTSPANAFIDAYDSLLAEYDNDPGELAKVVQERCMAELYDGSDRKDGNLYAKERLKIFEQLEDIGICGSIFIHYYIQPPKLLVFETDFHYFSWPLEHEMAEKPRTIKEFASTYYNAPKVSAWKVHEFFDKTSTELSKFPEKMREIFKSKNLSTKKISLQKQIDPPKDHFERPDTEKILKQLEEKGNLNKKEKELVEFLKFSRDNVANADKFYWDYPDQGFDKMARWHHYIFPWCKQLVDSRERIMSIHHFVRSWFKLCEFAGAISWVGYGNLIGWYRHSRNLPWDTDVDVVMPFQDLVVLSEKFNASLVIENPELGDNIFWFATTPYFYQQKDTQFIDARYIDLKTGFYIDVSALWNSNERGPPDHFKDEDPSTIYHCKHYNWFSHSELFPLRRTLYEGGQAYVPHDYESIMMHKYGKKSMEATRYEGHNWQEDIGIWVPNEICEKDAVPPKGSRFDSDGSLTLFGACNDSNILEEWARFKDLYEIHKKEFKG
ncbi:uncharacterized protein CYBJADRAFT_170148, partial [Cyberlindnera jadinii NRRL Y-1542]